MTDEIKPQFTPPTADANYTIGVDPAYPGDDAPFWMRMNWRDEVYTRMVRAAAQKKDWRTYYELQIGDPCAPLFTRIEAAWWLLTHRRKHGTD
jgi:hypothetical protein